MDKFILLVFFLSFSLTPAEAQTGNGAAFPSARPKLFVSVLSGTVNNSVGQSRRVGVFVRAEGDTAWTIVPNSNTLAFGAGFSRLDTTTRYYVCGGNGLFRSDDDGVSWRMLTNWRTMEVLDVAVDPRNQRNIYIATPFGVFRSIDDGASWNESIRGMKKWFVQNVVFDRARPNVLYAVSEDDLYRSDDLGERWTPLHAGAAEVRAMLQHPVEHSTLMAGTEDEGIRVSADGGRTWSTAAGTSGQTILAFSASRDGSMLYAGGFKTGLLKSTDNGRSWEKISGLSLINESINAILADPSDAAHVYLGTNGSGLWESVDGGISWKQTALHGTIILQIGMFP